MMRITAYCAPYFSSNITASQILWDCFEVQMNYSLQREKLCLLLRKGSLNIANVFWETKCVKGIYLIQPSSVKATALWAWKLRTESASEDKNWNDVLGHISSDSYRTLSNLVQDVTEFPRSIINDH